MLRDTLLGPLKALHKCFDDLELDPRKVDCRLAARPCHADQAVLCQILEKMLSSSAEPELQAELARDGVASEPIRRVRRVLMGNVRGLLRSSALCRP